MVDFTRWMLGGAFVAAFFVVGSFAGYAWEMGAHGLSCGAWVFAALQWAGAYFAAPRRVVVVIKGEV